MPDSLKIGVSLLVLVSVFFLFVSIALFYVKENEKDKRVSLEAQLDKVVEEKDGLSKSLDELKLVNKDLETKLASSHQQMRSLSDDYAKEKEARELLMAELEKEKREVKELVDEIMSEKEEKVGMVQRLVQAENDYKQLKNQLSVIVQAKETLERKVKDIVSKKGIELEKIVVQADGSIPNYPEPVTYDDSFVTFEEPGTDTMRGEILVVNRKFNFVVVNMGKVDGLRLGDGIEIYRNEELVAEAQIEKLYDRMSAATILPQYVKAGIKTGDEVLVSQ